METITINIPAHISFSELGLKRRIESGETVFNEDLLYRVAEENGLLEDELTEDLTSCIIINWYLAHRAAGGDLDLVAEQLAAEVQAQESYGMINVIRGGGIQ
jgi:hypothetical protein